MFKSLKGMDDILPADIGRWHTFETKTRGTMHAFGYEEIRTPLLEETELFTRSVGSASDIVEKGMFSIQDEGDTSISLRPENTASVLRSYLEHHMGHGNPVSKLFYIGPMFRHERPQKGRLRQFHQLGAEVIGSDDPLVDADLIAVLMHVLDVFGAPEIKLHLNSVGDSECRPPYRAELQRFLTDISSKLCENCLRRKDTNPMRVFDCKEEACKAALRDAPLLSDRLCDGCKEHFDRVGRTLKSAEIEFTINPRIVRGLDYYTRTAFEVTIGGLGSQNAVAGGGRYDGLAEEIGGPKTPGIGFALGIERLMLSATKLAAAVKPSRVEFIPLEDAARDESFKLTLDLRRKIDELALPAQADISYGVTSLKSALRSANRSGAKFAVLIGSQELSKGAALVKDLAAHAQEEIPFSELTKRLLKKLT